MWKPSFRRLLNRVFQTNRSRSLGRRGGKPGKTKWATCPLTLEQLEDRTVLATLLDVVSPLSAPLPPSDSAGSVAQAKSSADGRYVVYTSSAPNLVVSQMNQSVSTNVFLYDSLTDATTLVSHSAGVPNQTGNGSSGFPRISGNGRYVAFTSAATDLTSSQDGPRVDGNVYLYDTQDGAITLVSHGYDFSDLSANEFSSTQPTTGFGFNTTNDRYLIYTSYATDLVEFQFGPNRANLFRYDTVTGENILISHTPFYLTEGGDDDTFAADISEDGQSIAFSSLATNLVDGYFPAIGHLPNDLYLWTATGSSSGAVELLSGVYDPFTDSNSPVEAAGLGSFALPALSPDAFIIAFLAASGDPDPFTGLVPNPLVPNQEATSAPAAVNVFNYNAGDGRIYLNSGAVDFTDPFNPVPSANVMSNGDAVAVAVSANTTSTNDFTIAYISNATNIYPDQGPYVGNVFLYHPYTNLLTLASSIADSIPLQAAGDVLVDPDSDLTDLSISADGRFVTYQSFAPDIVFDQAGPAGVINTFIYDQVSGTNALLSRVPGLSQPTGADNHSTGARVNADGTVVAFVSFASNLAPAGFTVASGGGDLYLFEEFGTGPLLLSSQSAFQANATSLVYSTSADGRYTVFTSNSPSVVAGQADFNRDQDVFLSDRNPQTGDVAYTLVSHIPGDPTEAGDFGSPHSTGAVGNPGDPAAISADGNWIVFESRATNLVPGQHTSSPYIDSAFVDNVFLYERQTGTVTLVSHVPGDPSEEGEASSFDPVISADGRYIAYVSYAKNLVNGLFGFQNDYFRANVFLYDRVTDTTNILSNVGDTPVLGDGDSRNPSISDNGRYIAFQSRATNLIPAATVFPSNNIYLVDQFAPGGNTTLVSHVDGDPFSSPDPSTAPGAFPSVASYDPVISSDGNYIAFVSFATNLVPNQTEAFDTTDIFVYDRRTGTNTLVSGVAGSDRVTADYYSDSPAINTDGSAIAFRSSAEDLVVGQTGPLGSNIFLWNRQGSTAEVTLVSHAAGLATTTASGDSTAPFIDGHGSLVAYLSTADNLVAGQSGGGINNVFGWLQSKDTNFLVSGQDGSATVISPFPTFRPIISRDPFILFSVNGSITTGGIGTVNGYVNVLAEITLVPAAFPDGSPSDTVVGTLSIDSVLVGQVLLAQFSVPAGGPPDNGLFKAGSTQVNGMASLLTQTTINVGTKSSFSIVVLADLGVELGVYQRAFELTAPPARVATTAALSVMPNPAILGQVVTIGLQVSESGPGTPTGTVTFFDGTATLGTGMLDGNGFTSITTSSLNVGSHTLGAGYSGDSLFLASTAPSVGLTINPQTGTTLLLTAAPNPATPGQTITLVATVAPAVAGAGTPTGTVTFFDGPAVLATLPLDGNGQASMTTTGLLLGSHTLGAGYSGSALYLPSSAPAVSQTIRKVRTTLALASTPNPVQEGVAAAFTATLRDEHGANLGGRTITLLEGAAALGTVVTDANGQAALSLGFGQGNHDIRARYDGDGQYEASTSPLLTQTVTPPPTGVGPVTHFTLVAPATVVAGPPFSVTVTALNAGNEQVVGYQGTVQFTSSDGTALLPADYTFTGADSGTRTFTVALRSPGSFTLTVAEAGAPAVAGSAIVQTTKAMVAPPSNLTAIASQFTHSQEYFTYFLTQAYNQLVNRPPAEHEFKFFLDNIFGGAKFTVEHIEALFIGAPEYIQKKGGSDPTWITSMYTDLLFRQPRVDEMNYWLTRLGQIRLEHAADPTYNANVQAAEEFDTSDEREGYRVQANYSAYLGRLGDAGEVNYWVYQFKHNGQTSEDLAAGFVGSFEYFNSGLKGYGDRSAWILAAYRDVLHRQPRQDEVDYWLGQLN